ncbi:hypothetical protein ACFXD5_41460 [Streptomyces sp. NPDC059385]|uniref:hypothetical protein n=1 Tax=Streptomyces sp. NPDC059385 TaxID=3346817 RepID=UPI00369AB939
MRFTDLSGDLLHPAVDGFLSAVDRVMNSNTLLLKIGFEVPVTEENRQAVLRTFLRSDRFEEMTLAADHVRDWYNLSNPYDETPAQRPLVREGFLATVSPLDREGFTARLRWMLREAFSPYGKHLGGREAERLAGDFTGRLLEGEADGTAWRFASVAPDFLRSTCYYTQEEPLRPAYFDGGPCDTATFAHRDHVGYLLLTNGSP